MTNKKPQKIAVLVPCYNEEATITSVVEGFKKELPEAQVYVYDNNSLDKTREKAIEAGAVCRTEPQKGKGNVVRRMFGDIEADIYVLVDGDHTYEVSSIHKMIDKLMTEHLDMVVGVRKAMEKQAYPLGHKFGNRLFTGFIAFFFGQKFNDVLSGYRVFSKRFVKSFPCMSQGFEIETELTVHSLDLNIPVGEVETPYMERPIGSQSKLSTFRDGFKIFFMIGLLVKEIRPFLFFSSIFGVLAFLSLLLGIPVILHFFETGFVPRLPTTILSASIMLLGFLFLFCGVILDSVSRGRKELKKLWYLSYPHKEE